MKRDPMCVIYTHLKPFEMVSRRLIFFLFWCCVTGNGATRTKCLACVHRISSVSFSTFEFVALLRMNILLLVIFIYVYIKWRCLCCNTIFSNISDGTIEFRDERVFIGNWIFEKLDATLICFLALFHMLTYE